ncbi:aldo/keto reductase [Bacillus sp. 3255]|uniref:aldo/keto reductase n=1 Tax=Bacillus sp. 3255 TaxID=2817904 RepID=UPI002863A2A1|nr:aldo/keto reductase [Bacillus sp. 3255]MDR6884537.1 aryl-alcohol dehydrogenase-like predicted oxidoreductase [Bacillus sp. 3255]
MKAKKLGNAGFDISTITFGCWELGGGPWEFTNDQNNIALIRQAFEQGVTTFDTAEGYGNGHSEEIVGAALADIRKDCIITTKVSRSNLSPQDVRKSAENSLSRLKTDYIDIYYIHWPSFEIPVQDTLSEFVKLKEEGLIRAIGVSNFSLEQLKEAVSYAQIDVIQPEYSLLHRAIEPEIVPFCEEHSIGIMSYSSIAKGILTGAFHLQGKTLKADDFRSTRRLFLPEHMEAEKELLSLMKELADAKQATVSQIAIAWLLHQEALTSAIIGTQDEHHLRNNVAAAALELSASELEQLSAVSNRALSVIGYN